MIFPGAWHTNECSSIVLGKSQGERLSTVCQKDVVATKLIRLGPRQISSKSTWVFCVFCLGKGTGFRT